MLSAKRYHIICDLKNCNGKIGEEEALETFIKELVGKIKMSILHGPVITKGIPKNPGLSAFAVVDFSHVSVHTFTNFKEALVDIFSCKEFDKNEAVKYCLKFFDVQGKDAQVKKVWWG